MALVADEVMARVLWEALSAYSRCEGRLRRARGVRARVELEHMVSDLRAQCVDAGADEFMLSHARQGRLREIEYLVGRKGGDYRG